MPIFFPLSALKGGGTPFKAPGAGLFFFSALSHRGFFCNEKDKIEKKNNDWIFGPSQGKG